MKTATYEMSIDLVELYLAVLKRKCRIEVCGAEYRCLVIRITEDDGTDYLIRLWDNIGFMKLKKIFAETL